MEISSNNTLNYRFADLNIDIFSGEQRTSVVTCAAMSHINYSDGEEYFTINLRGFKCTNSGKIDKRGTEGLLIPSWLKSAEIGVQLAEASKNKIMIQQAVKNLQRAQDDYSKLS